MIKKIIILLLLVLSVVACNKKKYQLADNKYKNGLSYLNMGALEQAERDLLESLKLKPDNGKAHSALGQVYYSKKRFELALPEFEKARRLDKSIQEPYFFSGNIYLELHRLDEAIKEFKDLLAMTSFGYPHIVYNALGIAYQEKGEYITAIKQFREAINFQPDFPMAYYNLGLAYVKMENNDQAIMEFKKAIGFLPEYLEAYNQLGLLYLKIGDKKSARENFKKVYDLGGESELAKSAKTYMEMIKE